MRTPSTSSEQTAAPATPSTFNVLRSHATPPGATVAAAQPPWTACVYKPSRIVRKAQPGGGVAHSGSHAPHLASSLQVPGIAEDLDETEGLRTVQYDAPVSFEGVEGTPMAFAVKTAAEVLEPCPFTEAANGERRNSHLAAQKPNHTGGVDPDYPKFPPAPADGRFHPSLSTSQRSCQLSAPSQKACHIARPSASSLRPTLGLLTWSPSSGSPSPSLTQPTPHSRTTGPPSLARHIGEGVFFR
jgi:hypothetical protein